MAAEGSITHWIRGVKAGQETAAQRLWERYYRRLVALARRRLEGAPRLAADEQDVAQEAFASFCLGARRGRFPLLADRDDLWRLLVTITAHKAIDRIRRERRMKRGGGRVQVAFSPDDDSEDDGDVLDRFVGDEPTPDFAVAVAEELEGLLKSLGDETLRDVAIWKMDGYTNDEIAGRLGCSLRTVARKLALVRKRLRERGGSCA